MKDNAIQSEMFPLEDVINDFACGDAKVEGNYTAVRIKKKKPELYKVACTALAFGWSKSEIERLLNINFRTLQAIEINESSFIQSVRKNLGKRFYAAANTALEIVNENIGKFKNVSKISELVQLNMLAAVAADKGQLLTGEATSRVDVNSNDDYVDWRDIEKEANVVEGEIVKEQ